MVGELVFFYHAVWLKLPDFELFYPDSVVKIYWILDVHSFIWKVFVKLQIF